MDLSQLPGIADLGAGGLLALVILLVVFGKLAPKARLDELKAMYEAQIERMERSHTAEVTELRAGNNAYRTIVSEQSNQIGDLSRSVETSSYAMESLRTIAASRNVEDGSHAS